MILFCRHFDFQVFSTSTVFAAGEDSSLRSFSTVAELLNKNFGIASFNKKLSKKHRQRENPVKMKPIIGSNLLICSRLARKCVKSVFFVLATDFTSETTRDKDWDNIVCAHRNTLAATTWSFGNQTMGSFKLKHKRYVAAATYF